MLKPQKNMTTQTSAPPRHAPRVRLSRSPGRREATRSRFAEPVNAEPEPSEPVLFAGHTRPEQFFFFCSSVWIGLPMVLVLFADTLGWRRRAWTSPTPWLAGLANLPASFVHWGDYHEHGRKQVVDVALAGLQLLTLLGETAYGCGWFVSGAPDPRPTPPTPRPTSPTPPPTPPPLPLSYRSRRRRVAA